ncbi:small GTP-binding protein [Histomonas meleagridis]|uniref:small GTP-binding protein n=1 Tax=Histomonas meleagridis TaxID=135588 RepID=UPI00355AB1D0|nr:small GTP-binding protein [Histomonas meleagridis]KAH0796083.1 small GTP-binding protein [Histomonas meleagridis]
MQASEKETIIVKVVFVGTSSVGKTSLMNATTEVDIEEPQAPTIGACFIFKTYEVEDSIIRLHIWDTAGQERFRSLTPSYFRDAEYIIIVYAVNNRPSFEEVDKWYESILNSCPNRPSLILIGNKIDLTDDVCVLREEGKQKAEQIGASFYEMSAKTKPPLINIVFQNIVNDFVANRSIKYEYSAETKIEFEAKKGCC